MRKKMLSILFTISFLTLFLITGWLEENYISCGQAALYTVIDTTIVIVSGFKSGLLRLADRR